VDPEAIRVAKTNGEANGVRHGVRFEWLALERLPFRGPKYDVICANLTDDLLLAHSRRLRVRLQPGGVLVLAGILAGRFLVVRRHFEKSGLRLRSSQTETGWESGAFVLEPGSRARRRPSAAR
jgi:ribosomal protein L11 methylase PrmA